MAANRFLKHLGRVLAICLALAGLSASEHQGVVKSGGEAVPGATVTATQGDKKFVTTTDDQGAYTFPDLTDGVWTITVEMLGFAKHSEEVGVAPTAPSPVWDLKQLSAADLKTALAEANQPTPAPAAIVKPAEAQVSAPAAAATQSATAQPSVSSTTTPAPQSSGGRGGSGGRGTGQGGNRPSLRNSLAQNGQNGGRGGFQQMDLNASALTDGAAETATDGAAAAPADQGQSADAFVVGGSISSGVTMPQTNDWFGGRGGMDGMGFGQGGPGGMGPGGLNGDGMQNPGAGPQIAGGPGGPGGPGGRGGGGPGGGGFGGGRGGFGGGGRGAGRAGGRNGRGRNPNAFGNGRRDPRMHYNGNLAIIYGNSDFNARPYSLTGQATAKPSTSNARMTGMIGGPLKIPHILSGQKTFFTLNFQFTDASSGSTTSTLVPTAAERSGDFSNVLGLSGQPVTIYDPTTHTPFPNNAIPASMVSPIATALLSYYPLPNFPGNSRYNYQTALVSNSQQDNINSRVSETINTKNQVNGNFSYQHATGVLPSLLGWTQNTFQSASNSGINWTYHFTTHLFNTAGVSFSRNVQDTTPYWANRANLSAELGITGNDQSANFWGPPSLSFANGFYGLSDGSTSKNRAQTTAFTESIRWFHDKHNFTFGGDIRRVDNDPLSEQNARGSFTFTGTNTALNGQGGFDMADFLLGLPDTSQIAYGNADKYYRNGWFDLYAVDDWRIATKFSINIGLRWDYQLPTTEEYGRLVNLAIGPGFATATPVCATAIAGCTVNSQLGYTNSLMNGDAREFQPRLGIAWRPTNNTVVRAGDGIYYNTTAYQSIVSQMAQQSPLSFSSIVSSTQTPLSLSNFSTGSGFPTFAVDPNFRIGYVNSWQVSVQQTLPWSLVGTVTYSGSKGTHQMEEFIPNSAPAGTTYWCTTCPTNFYYLTSGGNTISNQLWLQMQHRFHNGFMANVVYAHANMIDEGSSGGRGAAASIAQDWLDLNAERARSSGIRANTLNANVQFSIGMGARGGALMKGVHGKLMRDWTLMTGIVLSSGAPETPNVLTSALGGTGITGPLRAEYTGLPVYLPNGNLNPAAFVAPLSGTYGNAGRDIITGPMTFSLNASASRIIRLTERKSLDLQVNSTNPLNHVYFTSWNTTVGSTQYGLPSATGAMRSMSLTMRFRF